MNQPLLNQEIDIQDRRAELLRSMRKQEELDNMFGMNTRRRKRDLTTELQAINRGLVIDRTSSEYHGDGVRITYGLWKLVMKANGGDFALSVWTGREFSYHPAAALDKVIEYFGKRQLKRWKQAVMSEFDEAMAQIFAVIPDELKGNEYCSLTCTESSERLCKSSDYFQVIKHHACFTV